MADAAISKVEDAIAAQIAAWPALSGWTVIADQSKDDALAEGSAKHIVIYTMAHAHQLADELNQTLHTVTMEIEVVDQAQAVGTVSRANRAAIAHIVAAIASDRSVGGRLQDIQEIDTAPAGAEGRDVGSASIQFRVEFFTPRSDWFVILGQSGQQF